MNARQELEAILWPNGPICPHCKNTGAWAIQGPSVRKGLYRCKQCRKQFTVTIGTVMHRSHLPIEKWLIAAELMKENPKITSTQLAEKLDIACPTAWRMRRLIRIDLDTGQKFENEIKQALDELVASGVIEIVESSDDPEKIKYRTVSKP